MNKIDELQNTLENKIILYVNKFKTYIVTKKGLPLLIITVYFLCYLSLLIITIISHCYLPELIITVNFHCYLSLLLITVNYQC